MRSNPPDAKENSARGPLALIITIAGILGRLLPHPPNFAPVDSASLFAGARLPFWQAYLVPLVVMAVTDPILAMHYGVRPFTRWQFFTYSSFLLSVWIGRRIRNSRSVLAIGGAAVLCSAQFFLITNFGVWATTSQYAPGTAGLFACYAAAIPFYGWTLAADLFYTAVMFGLYALLKRMTAAHKLPASA